MQVSLAQFLDCLETRFGGLHELYTNRRGHTRYKFVKDDKGIPSYNLKVTKPNSDDPKISEAAALAITALLEIQDWNMKNCLGYS